MELRVNDLKSYRTQFRRFNTLTVNEFDNRFQQLLTQYHQNPSALFELEEICEIPYLNNEIFVKEYQNILGRVEEVFRMNNMRTNSLTVFKKLIDLKPFMKRVLRDFFLTNEN